MNRLSIYYTGSHASVTVEGKATQRETSGRTMPDVLNNLQTDDLGVLVAFCKAVVEYSNGNRKMFKEF